MSRIGFVTMTRYFALFKPYLTRPQTKYYVLIGTIYKSKEIWRHSITLMSYLIYDLQNCNVTSKQIALIYKNWVITSVVSIDNMAQEIGWFMSRACLVSIMGKHMECLDISIPWWNKARYFITCTLYCLNPSRVELDSFCLLFFHCFRFILSLVLLFLMSCIQDTDAWRVNMETSLPQTLLVAWEKT